MKKRSSPERIRASRKNGKLGGRPRKEVSLSVDPARQLAVTLAVAFASHISLVSFPTALKNAQRDGVNESTVSEYWQALARQVLKDYVDGRFVPGGRTK